VKEDSKVDSLKVDVIKHKNNTSECSYIVAVFIYYIELNSRSRSIRGHDFSHAPNPAMNPIMNSTELHCPFLVQIPNYCKSWCYLLLGQLGEVHGV